MRTILVPLDGSTFSEEAIPVALAVARRTSATIQLARVYEPPEPLVGSETTPFLVMRRAALDSPLYRSMVVATRQAQESYLQTTTTRIAQSSGVNVTFTLLTGLPVNTLVAHIVECNADLVVMATHGRSGLSRIWLGSVAERVVRLATAPVLLVKPGVQEESKLERPFRRVLVPLDGSPASEAAIEEAIAVAGMDGVIYDLVGVTEPMSALVFTSLGAVGPSAPQDVGSLEHQMDAYLRSVEQRLRDRGIAVSHRALVQRSVAHAILEMATETRADLIAAATHGRKGIERLLMGSVADKVLRGAECCVLLCRTDHFS